MSHAMLEVVPVVKLRASKDNPRRSPGDVTELAATIAAIGVIESLIGVRLLDGDVEAWPKVYGVILQAHGYAPSAYERKRWR